MNSEHVMSKKIFLEVPFWHFLALHMEEEEMYLDGTHPLLFTGSICVCMPIFRFEGLFLFLEKVKGCGHINMLITFPW